MTEPLQGPSVDFRISITEALKAQLGQAIATCQPAALTLENLGELTAKGGVYELYLAGARVYVGKAEKSLPERLTQHFWKIHSRNNIDVNQMTFVCAYILEDLSATAPETLLIAQYANDAGRWNNSGFGNKDPGRNRDTSWVKTDHFDAQFPIKLDWPVNLDGAVDLADPDPTPKEWPVFELLKALKKELPYNLRFQLKGKEVMADYNAAVVTLPRGPLPASEIFAVISTALGENWQITALPGYVIVYREEPKKYLSALMTWPELPLAVQNADTPAEDTDEELEDDEDLDGELVLSTGPL